MVPHLLLRKTLSPDYMYAGDSQVPLSLDTKDIVGEEKQLSFYPSNFFGMV